MDGRATPIDVVDVGAGTGKLTARLLAAGHRVVAVEPLDELRGKLADALPQARALSGRAEALPVPDACADAVVVGQAFHWFEAAPALAKVARVLRPGGRLGLIWNFRDDSQPWMRELSAIAGQDGLPDGWWSELAALPEIESSLDGDGLLALVRSWSTVASQDEARRQGLLRQIEELCDRHSQLRGSTGTSLAYRTETHRLRLGPYSARPGLSSAAAASAPATASAAAAR